jgi:hypothetical protein
LNFKYIHLYADCTTKNLDLHRVAKGVSKTFPNCIIDIRIPFLQYITNSISSDWLAEELASIHISDTKQPYHYQPERRNKQAISSVLFEKNLISNPHRTSLLYDGFEMQSLYSRLLPVNEKTIDNIHIIFDSRLTCTFSEEDYRYHARAIICGTPSIISTTGIVEGPAKPKDFYFRQIAWISSSGDIEELKKQYAGRFIDYDDDRINSIAVGYTIQALFFFLTDGDPFCNDIGCKIFNAHWQEDLLRTQVNNQRMCQKHLLFLDRFLNRY